MISKTFRRLITQSGMQSNQFNLYKETASLNQVNQMSIGHIKNMLDQNLKVEVQKVQNTPILTSYNRIYKPSHTIEFNREGQVVLYSCDPLKHSVVYFKYPYILYEATVPIFLFNFVFNPYDLEWYWSNMNLVAIYLSWIPRMWYWRSLQYKISKISLLRGGKVAKIETQNLSNDRFTSWVETYQFKPLTQDQKHFDDRDKADFLETEGQLQYELAVEFDNIVEMGTNTNNVVYSFMREGVVHQPELFEAVVKGYHIDTSDYVINTVQNDRARQGNYGQ